MRARVQCQSTTCTKVWEARPLREGGKGCKQQQMFTESRTYVHVCTVLPTVTRSQASSGRKLLASPPKASPAQTDFDLAYIPVRSAHSSFGFPPSVFRRFPASSRRKMMVIKEHLFLLRENMTGCSLTMGLSVKVGGGDAPAGVTKWITVTRKAPPPSLASTMHTSGFTQQRHKRCHQCE